MLVVFFNATHKASALTSYLMIRRALIVSASILHSHLVNAVPIYTYFANGERHQHSSDHSVLRGGKFGSNSVFALFMELYFIRSAP